MAFHLGKVLVWGMELEWVLVWVRAKESEWGVVLARV
jgi:hypothetical protein